MLHIGTPFFSDESDRRKIVTSIASWFFLNITAAVKSKDDGHNERKSYKRLKERFGHKEKNSRRNFKRWFGS